MKYLLALLISVSVFAQDKSAQYVMTCQPMIVKGQQGFGCYNSSVICVGFGKELFCMTQAESASRESQSKTGENLQPIQPGDKEFNDEQRN